MPDILHGERIARGATLRLTISAAVFDATGAILLARRSDSGLWGIPGGKMEAGEAVAEAVQRETLEETGVRVEIVQLAAIYSDPHRVVAYSDGRQVQIVNLCFVCRPLSALAILPPDADTAEVRYFALDKLPPLLDQHDRRIADATDAGGPPIIA